MAVRIEVSVVSDRTAYGARSRLKRPTNSAAKCCASAALPPLPATSTLRPARSVSTSRAATSASVPQRAQEQRQADLDRVVEGARVEPGQRGDLVQAVAERVAVDEQPVRGRRRAAVLEEEGVEGLEQLPFLVERAKQVHR